MLNRIRRAISRTRSLRALNGAPYRPVPPDRPTLATAERSLRTDVLPGQDAVLVRPYMLTPEKRASRRSVATSHSLNMSTRFVAPEAV
ncbi:hypothetical protein [Streptomyces sp. NPDC088557]|uniref:hypothetical protein n=1 Tax=Streptomyces sp. NPDC088557 TaxID=3365867 RepID=UPI0037F367D4